MGQDAHSDTKLNSTRPRSLSTHHVAFIAMGLHWTGLASQQLLEFTLHLTRVTCSDILLHRKGYQVSLDVAESILAQNYHVMFS
jgi:hypothetical protein